MKYPAKNSKSIITLWIAFTIGTVLSLLIMFQAGCAGDAKTGSLGDPVRALQMENIAFFSLLFSVSIGGLAFGLGSSSPHRVSHGLSFAFFGMIFLWIIGIQISFLGTQSCF
ncbi:MAG: hypothetical protein WA154_04125 [Moraxellaceae bacterium]